MIKWIKSRMLKFVIYFVNRFGFQLISHSHLANLVDYNLKILDLVDNNLVNGKIDSIVFSKDRAMQLHAFLLSYIEQVINRSRMYIIFKCSNQRHQKSYDQLKALFISEDFVFIEEINFRDQLNEILEHSDAGKVIFYVDDMIFTHRIDYDLLSKVDSKSSVLALSRGKDMDFSIVLQKPLILPTFTKMGNNLEQFKWNFSSDFSDWTYPLGVSGYMFGRIEISSMLKSISFKAPNSLESAMQVFLIYFTNRFGLCFEYSPCVCVHANLVQTECKNPVLGTFSVNQLLDLWENGLKIQVAEFYNKPMSVTQVQSYKFV